MASVPTARNAPCPCGSGQRYKACCGRLETTFPVANAALPTAVTPAAVTPAQLSDLGGLIGAGRYLDAETQVAALIAHYPDLGVLWQILAVSLAKQGKETHAAWERVTILMPSDAGAHNNLGNSFGRLGRPDDAVSCYRRAIEINANFAEAHNNLAGALIELGQFEDALVSGRRALGLRPDFVPAYVSIGDALAGLERLGEAIASYDRALLVQPHDAEIHNKQGAARLAVGQLDAAMTSFQRAVSLSPSLVAAHINLGQALRALGRLDEAIAHYRQAISLRSDNAEAHGHLGAALRLAGRTAEAESQCQRALDLNPNLIGATLTLGEARADVGRFSEAQDWFARAMALQPEAPEVWASTARIRHFGDDNDDAWLLAACRVADRPMPARRELPLRYAIGKGFDDRKNFQQAFAHYQRANALARQCGPGHDRAAFAHTIDRIIHTQDRAWLDRFRGQGVASRRPVFIVGMLRSGTSLTEQILASHPAVFGAGELPFWGAAAASGGGEDRIPTLARDYLDRLQQLSGTAPRITDKMPANFLHLGLIHAALPETRIIHMRRDPIDTCLSIYFQHFEATLSYANDLDDLADYYRQYSRLMRHWRQTLPEGAILDVSYEGLVAEPETWIHAMLTFIGLAWDARCLEFHATDRAVITASKWQVRQKLNTTAVQRWRSYAPYITPLLSLRDDNPVPLTKPAPKPIK